MFADGEKLAALGLQPIEHVGDFFGLRVDDLLRHRLGPRVRAVFELCLRHVDRTLVMRDHAAHEGNVDVLGHHAFVHVLVHVAHALHEVLMGLVHLAHVSRVHFTHVHVAHVHVARSRRLADIGQITSRFGGVGREDRRSEGDDRGGRENSECAFHLE